MIEIGPNLTKLLELLVLVGAIGFGYWLMSK